MLTRKEAVNMCSIIFHVPYGADNSVLRWNAVKIGFNAGVYGWNWTVYTLEDFEGTLIEGYRNYPSWVTTPTDDELEELHNAYQNGDHELLVDLLGKVQGDL